ncbi:MAG: glycoside hydrolase family 43 protein, partial [Planctomycetota bacterium]
MKTTLLSQKTIILVLMTATGLFPASAAAADPAPLDIREIRIRDPFILTDPKGGQYYMIANMGNRRRGAKGWECYTSKDLRFWQPPVAAFTPPKGFWADRDFWAPEIHRYRGKYYLFGTLSAATAKRGTQIFVAEGPLGPFRAHSDRAATPHEWMALDGTLYVEDGRPWMVFCHEWVQIDDGTIDAVRLSDDLSKPLGKPIKLLSASDAPWVRPIRPGKYVTDGPCLHKLPDGQLLMLWSSFGQRGYTVGIARSPDGSIRGPWRHDPKPLHEGGGHSMLFRKLDGTLMLVLHGPNRSPEERARFFEVRQRKD